MQDQADAKIRLYVEQPLGAGQDVALSEAHAHYLFQVLRKGMGTRVALFNNRDGEWQAEVVAAAKRAGTVRCIRQSAAQRMPPDLWLLFAPIKKARTDFIVEKAAELGAARILPVQTEFTNSERIRQDRLQAHAVEAAEQCGGTFVPNVDDLQPLTRVLAEWDETRTLIWADEALSETRPNAALPAAPAAILIGPEGGFSERERARLRALPFVHPINLGPRILRADTAAVSALTLWQQAQGDWSKSSIETLETALKAELGEDAPRLGKKLKEDWRSIVVEARWRNEAVIVKQFKRHNAEAIVAELQDEHRRLADLFPIAGLNVAQLAHSIPHLGVAVVQKVPGAMLTRAMENAGHPNQRSHMVQRLGAWLGRSASQSQTLQTPQLGWAGKHLGRKAREYPLNAENAALIDGMARLLEAKARELEQIATPHAITHADFTPQNFAWDAASDTLWAYDTQKTHHTAIAASAARMVVALSMYPIVPDSGEKALERMAQDYDAIAQDRVINDALRQTEMLEFFTTKWLGHSLLVQNDRPTGPALQRLAMSWLAQHGA